MFAGCFSKDSLTTQVGANPFGQEPAVVARQPFVPAPASTEAAARVDLMGRKILAANPQMGVKPQFRTIGAPQTEVFHFGLTEVNITEGLVKQCQTDGQLAAVLSMELGKMISEREALASPQTRVPDREPPMEVRIGNDSASDLTHLAELARYDKERRRPSVPPPPPPDPKLLARTYLAKAGFAEKELDDAASLFQAAQANNTLEKQLAPK
jgi:hypothetical protein